MGEVKMTPDRARHLSTVRHPEKWSTGESEDISRHLREWADDQESGDSVSATIEISDGHHITKAAYSTIRPLTPEGALELAGLLVAGAKAIGS